MCTCVLGSCASSCNFFCGCLLVALLLGLISNAGSCAAYVHDRAAGKKPRGYLNGAALTEIQMNAGNKGVDKEHEDHHAKDGHTLHQENLVTYSVLSRGKGENKQRYYFVSRSLRGTAVKSHLLLQFLNVLFPVFILLRNLSVRKP